GVLGLLGGIAIATAGWWALGPRPAAEDDSVRESAADVAQPADVYLASLAVLPFANRSDNPENEYFTDGVHDDILTELSRLEGLKLISRTSVMRYRDTETSIREIGQELGVATVLEGSVQRSGERVRITVQLIDADTDNHLWAETYDQELTAANVFAIQSDVARQIASALEATLVAGEPAEGRPPPTESLEAYDRLTEARFLLSTRDQENMRRSVDLYEEAIALDTNYAPAYTGLAEAYLVLYSWDQLTLEQIKPVVESALDRAMEIDPLQGEAYTARALFLRNLGRFHESERDWKRAIELVPGHANTRHWYGGMLWEVGRFDESRIEMRRALALDPLSRIISANVGLGEYFARDYDAAIAQYRRALDRYPDFSYTWILLSLAYSLNGQHQEALEAGRTALEISPGDLNYTQVLAFVVARAGDEAEARRLMESVTGSDPTRLALAHVALGETDEALRLVELAVDEGSPFRAELGDPAYDPIRAEPRFQEAMRRVGLID
ncbi:MAG: tetratricopeptide repeat protein, partial [Gemmatimonadota bacterium]